jgi:hypothetical protein
MQLYAVNFIPVLGFTLHVLGVLYTHHQEYNLTAYNCICWLFIEYK